MPTDSGPVDPRQPHYYERRPSIFLPFNLDASKPCRWCGWEPGADRHYPPTVQLYLARQEASP